ncbi:hypothetical protein CGRA01v4_14707 [Colletotrichum graminicola]|nr:hypothetical protein CGRA01v4_14707 [Colletotrichum graminicola]
MRFWSQGGVFFYKSWRGRLTGPTTKQHGQHRLGFCLLVRCLLLGEGLGKGWEVFCLSIPCGFSGNREPGFCCACLIFLFVFRFFVHSHFPQRNGKGQEWFASRHTSVLCFADLVFCGFLGFSFVATDICVVSLHVAGSGPAIFNLFLPFFFILVPPTHKKKLL